MTNRDSNPIVPLGILILACILVFQPAYAGNEEFTFLSKAISYYRNLPETHELSLTEKRPIDTNLIHTGAQKDFVKAYQTSWDIGLTLLEQGKHSQALDIFNDIRTFLDQKTSINEDEKKRYSSVLNIIGAIYEETGLWNEAMDMYMKSLQLCNEIGFKAGKAKIYNNLGKLYFNREELNKAENLFLQAININKELAISAELFNNYNNLAGVYLLRKNPTKALNYAFIALNQLDLEKDQYNLSIAYSNIGNLFQGMNNLPVALTYFRMAVDLQEKKSFDVALSGSYLAMASVFEQLKRNDSAEYYIGRALNLADKVGNPSEQLAVLRYAARHYSETDNYKRSSEFYSRYTSLNDSLESLNSLTKMEQIQAVYEVINKEKNNQILQQKINLQQLAIQRQRIILIAGLLILILLGFFFISTLRNRKRERKQNKLIADQKEAFHVKEKELMQDKERNLELELDYKNRQLTAYTLNLARNNELISRISEELKLILLGLSPRDKEKTMRIRNLLSTLQQYSSGMDWEEFRLYFQEVHQSFEKNLSAAYPDLSPNDKKICALLKLGLSTKDIAAITFRELRSVESARNRLRKKMGLAPDVNITNFLSQF